MSLLVKHEGNVGIITLNRPEVYNALNRNLLHDLKTTLLQLKSDVDTRVIIITGAGEKAFCSGADLKERITMEPHEVSAYIENIRSTFTLLEQMPQPVIAAINGLALGGGTELALACDLRIMAESASMGLTETRLGIIPGAGGTQRLPRLIGKGIAKELIFTGRRVEAEEAERIGLVNRVVAQQSLIEEALNLGKEISENAPIALAQAKWAINQGIEVSLDVGLELESMAYEVLIPTEDRQEGLRAFKEKRKPRYKGR